MIEYARVVRAAEDIHSDPREIDETIRDLGVDPEGAARALSVGTNGIVAQIEASTDETLSDVVRLAILKTQIVGFVIGLALGREAAHEEAPA